MRWAAIRAFLDIMGLAVKARSKGAGLLPRPLERAMEPAMGTVNDTLTSERRSAIEFPVYLPVVLRLGTCMHHGQALEILHISSPSKPHGIRAVSKAHNIYPSRIGRHRVNGKVVTARLL